MDTVLDKYHREQEEKAQQEANSPTASHMVRDSVHNVAAAASSFMHGFHHGAHHDPKPTKDQKTPAPTGADAV
jgi:hypothetical protein